MSWFRENERVWKEIIETVSNETMRSRIMIEKDTIQSVFLYELSKYDFPFVFKGGTSLSKSYDLIDRFSEDIDLSLSRKIKDSERKKSKEIILEIADKLDFVLTNPDNVLSRRNYNKYIFTYDSLFSDDKLEIIIETSYFQESFPVVSRNIQSFVGKFCKIKNVVMPIDFPAVEFEMNVQSLQRTFIDKVFAVCDYWIENMMDRDSRHLYDIAKIVPVIVFDDYLKELIVRVRNDRMKSINNPSADLEKNINQILKNIIETDFYKKDYNNITTKLLYEKYPYGDAIKNGIKVVLEKNVF